MDINAEVAMHREHLKSIDNTLEKHEHEIEKLSDQNAIMIKMASNMERMCSDMTEVKDDVKNLRSEYKEDKQTVDARMDKLEHKDGDMAKEIIKFVCAAGGGAFLTWLIGIIGSVI